VEDIGQFLIKTLEYICKPEGTTSLLILINEI